MTTAQGDMIVVRLNGAAAHVPPGTTVAQLLAAFRLPERGVAVEVSGEVVPRSRWAERPLIEGDRIELVHMVGGGA
jgi:thiamine biosynthesis protein ThiS